MLGFSDWVAIASPSDRRIRLLLANLLVLRHGQRRTYQLFEAGGKQATTWMTRARGVVFVLDDSEML
jgi:hypothetical protein